MSRPDWKPWYTDIGGWLGWLVGLFWLVVIVAIVLGVVALAATFFRLLWMLFEFAWYGVFW